MAHSRTGNYERRRRVRSVVTSSMSIISTEWEFPYWSVRSTDRLNASRSGRHLASAWLQTRSVLITRPYHWPGTQLKLTAGPATDLRGYEPNEPAHWWDGFRQAIPESPWGALPQSHSSPPSPVFAFSVSFILCKNRHGFGVSTRVYYSFPPPRSLTWRSGSSCLCMTSLPCFWRRHISWSTRPIVMSKWNKKCTHGVVTVDLTPPILMSQWAELIWKWCQNAHKHNYDGDINPQGCKEQD